MKKLFLAFMLSLTLGASQVAFAASAPKHRYTPSAQMDNRQAVQANDNPSVQATDHQTAASQDAVEAYSDTTSVDTAFSQVGNADDSNQSHSHSIYSLENYDDPFDFLGSVFGKGTLFFVMFIMLVIGLLFVFAPLIAIFIICRYLYRRHKDRMKIMEMAMEKGVDVPEEQRPIDKQSDEYLIKRGLRNFFLGAGLVAMFSFWNWGFMAGIGALVSVYGLGQLAMGYVPSLKKKQTGKNDDFTHGDFIKNEEA